MYWVKARPTGTLHYVQVHGDYIGRGYQSLRTSIIILPNTSKPVSYRLCHRTSYKRLLVITSKFSFVGRHRDTTGQGITISECHMILIAFSFSEWYDRITRSITQIAINWFRCTQIIINESISALLRWKYVIAFRHRVWRPISEWSESIVCSLVCNQARVNSPRPTHIYIYI